MRGAVLALLLAGCWPVPACPDSTSDLLAKCRAESIAAFDAGADAKQAEAVYERCKQREGLTP
jgi:hypothetical protein